jgi:RecB family endonuclease NucS
MAKPHLIVIKDPNNGILTHPLKSWLRQHPEHIPPSLDPDVNTSHELRRGLKKLGWELQITSNEVLIIQPDESGGTFYAEEFLDIKIDEDNDLSGAEDEDVSEVTFGLERDLQIALRANIEQLENGLKIVDGGVERITQAGRIDITAIDKEGNTVIIELKAGRAIPNVIAQVLSYMGAVGIESNTHVRGIIVAGDFSDRVILAVEAVPNLSLFVTTQAEVAD